MSQVRANKSGIALSPNRVTYARRAVAKSNLPDKSGHEINSRPIFFFFFFFFFFLINRRIRFAFTPRAMNKTKLSLSAEFCVPLFFLERELQQAGRINEIPRDMIYCIFVGQNKK